MSNALGAGVVARLEQPGTQEAHLDEIVEVAGLERGVLAVVREREQLLRLRGKRRVFPEPVPVVRT